MKIKTSGYVMVPVEATREIEDAIGRSRNLSASEIWEDALAAAPPVPDVSGLVEALELMVDSYDDGGWPTATIEIARAALAAHKQGGRAELIGEVVG